MAESNNPIDSVVNTARLLPFTKVSFLSGFSETRIIVNPRTKAKREEPFNLYMYSASNPSPGVNKNGKPYTKYGMVKSSHDLVTGSADVFLQAVSSAYSETSVKLEVEIYQGEKGKRKWEYERDKDKTEQKLKDMIG